MASRATSSFLVSVDEAKGIAMKKLPIRINPCDFVHLPLFTQLEANNVITIYDKNSIPTMYLFNKEGNDGFLLLSASKLEEPILAYSTESKLELSDMPRDLAVWIDLGVTKISQLN
ncbi:MAG: Spi family protease inhibitor [Myroides sp.]|nr:Spi family protease inhibitor [Myroides sp.]